MRIGNQANDYNGGRPDLMLAELRHPGSYPPCRRPAITVPSACRSAGTCWPKAKLSDEGFETEQKFANAMLLDAYVYGSFDRRRHRPAGAPRQPGVNWGESVFIQGVNQINPIDVPAARRAGAELKEILLPVWMAYANWGFGCGSIEAFYQLKWQNTSIDGCGTYWAVTENNISVDPGRCNSATVSRRSSAARLPGTASPLDPAVGSNPYSQANGLYVPLVQGKEAATAASSASRSASRSRSSTPNSACTPSTSIAPADHLGLAGSLPTELPGGAGCCRRAR